VTENPEDAAKVLQKMAGVKKVAIAQDDAVDSGRNGKLLHVTFEDAAGTAFSDIPNVLINNGFRLTKFAEEPINLETAFMRLTKGLVQ
jgi:ABC-2 type transport system ATP-binding protein